MNLNAKYEFLVKRLTRLQTQKPRISMNIHGCLETLLVKQFFFNAVSIEVSRKYDKVMQCIPLKILPSSFFFKISLWLNCPLSLMHHNTRVNTYIPGKTDYTAIFIKNKLFALVGWLNRQKMLAAKPDVLSLISGIHGAEENCLQHGVL